MPVSALVIGNTDTFSSGAPPYSGGGGYPYASAGIPHPARAFGKGYSYTSTGTPTPPAPSALLPRPRRGDGVRTWRYQVSSRARGGAGGKPYPALLRDLPVHWTVVHIATGGGADGEGELVPPLLSLTLQTPCFSLPAFLRGIPVYLAGIPHLARAFLPAHRPPNRTCALCAVSMCRRCCSLPLFHREQRHIRRLAGPREGEQILARQPGDHEPVALNPV